MIFYLVNRNKNVSKTIRNNKNLVSIIITPNGLKINLTNSQYFFLFCQFHNH